MAIRTSTSGWRSATRAFVRLTMRSISASCWLARAAAPATARQPRAQHCARARRPARRRGRGPPRRAQPPSPGPVRARGGHGRRDPEEGAAGGCLADLRPGRCRASGAHLTAVQPVRGAGSSRAGGARSSKRRSRCSKMPASQRRRCATTRHGTESSLARSDQDLQPEVGVIGPPL